MEADERVRQGSGTRDPLDLVELKDHDPLWKEEFLMERDRLALSLGSDILHIEHIGSTAVPGLRAKPVIDMMASVNDLDPKVFQERLFVLGYIFEPIDDRGRLFFRRGMPRTNHLHLVLEGGGELRKHILFRDRLIDHPEEAEDYAALKEALAQRFREDREAYSNAKTLFINKILARAEGNDTCAKN